MRLMVYSQDGMGLGHLRRTRNIAQEVLSLRPDCQVLAVADAPDAPFFPRLQGMDFVKLPTVVKEGPSRWQTRSSLGVADAVKLRSKMILEAFEAFQPDALLVDHMPVGVNGELKPTLDATGQTGKRPKLFLGLRDILDEPDAVAEAWTRLSAHEYMALYDTVLIHGCRDVYDAEAEYRLRPHARALRYNNYVAPRAAPPSNGTPGQDPFILAMGGGGADAFPLASAFLGALPSVLESQRLRAVLLTGPNMPASQREQLASQARGLPADVRTSSQDAIALIQDATAVVTMGGYNTLCEVLAWRKPALVVPRAGPSAEQRIRSRLFSERGLVRVLDPDELSHDRLADELGALLADGASLPDPANVPPLDGARRAAELLVGQSALPNVAVAGDAARS